MPGPKQKTTYPDYDMDLSGMDPEKLMEMFGVMAGAPKTPLVVDQRKDPSAGGAAPAAGMIGGGMIASAPMKPVPVQTGPGMNINPDDYDWKLMNPPDYDKMRTDSGPGGMAPYRPMGSQSGGASAGGVPDIDSMLKSMFDVGVGSGGTGGLWASPEQRAFAAKQQLEMMKLASGERSDQAKLEAARTDAQSQRDFQSGEKALDRTAQEAIANMQYGPAQFKKNIYGSLLQENMKRFNNDIRAATAETEKQMAESAAITDPSRGGSVAPKVVGPPVPGQPPAAEAALAPANRINDLLPQIGQFGPERPFTRDEAAKMLDLMSRSSLGEQDYAEIGRRINAGNFAGDPNQAMKYLAQAYARAVQLGTGQFKNNLELDDGAFLFGEPPSILRSMTSPKNLLGAASQNKIKIPTGQTFDTGLNPTFLGNIFMKEHEKAALLKQAEAAALLFRQMAAAQKQGR